MPTVLVRALPHVEMELWVGEKDVTTIIQTILMDAQVPALLRLITNATSRESFQFVTC